MRNILEVYSLTVRGGSETLMINHLKEMDRNEFHVDFVNHTQKKCDYDDEIVSLGSHLYHMPKFKIYNLVYYIWAWMKFFKVHPGYDVIHVHYFTLAPIIIPIAKYCGIKTRITHSHVTRKSTLYKRILLNMTRWMMVRNSTLLLACGREAGENIFGTSSFTVFKNAIPAEKYAFNGEVRNKIRVSMGISEDTFVIGNVGSFRSGQKNHSFIIDVFSKLLEKKPQSKLIFVGEGKLKPEMEKKVKKMKISDSVIFTGLRENTSDYYQAMDLFFFPSLYEGLGIAAIEAQESGLPTLLSTEVPVDAYISDLVSAYPLNMELSSWVDAILKLSEIHVERSLYSNVASIHGYNVKDNVKILESIYSDYS